MIIDTKIEVIRTAGMSVQGVDHKKKGKVCQDRVASLSKNGVHVIALSDGAGSCEFSHFGAEAVVQTIVEYLADHYDELFQRSEEKGRDALDIQNDIGEIKRSILHVILSSIGEKIKQDEKLTRDSMACTLLFVAVKKDTYLAGHIGDGVIGFLKSSGVEVEDKIDVLSGPENGGSPDITFFSTDVDAEEHFRIYSGHCTNLRGVILMSDGPEEVLYDQRHNKLSKNCNTFFSAFSDTPTENYKIFLRTLLETKIAEISYDDLSVNILYRDTIDPNDAKCKDVLSEVMSNIHKNQIERVSGYCVHVDTSIAPAGNVLKENDWRIIIEEGRL